VLSREGVTGVVCLAGSLVLLAATYGLPGATLLVPVGPAFYPRIILAITAILSVALIVADLVRRRRPVSRRSTPGAAAPNHVLVLTSFVTFGLYIAVLPWLGFRISTLLFVIALQAILDPPHGWKRWLTVVVVALATTIVAYFVFERYLLVLLPRGRLTDF
jgi:putative tricarboxylic transport membrane protein